MTFHIDIFLANPQNSQHSTAQHSTAQHSTAQHSTSYNSARIIFSGYTHFKSNSQTSRMAAIFSLWKNAHDAGKTAPCTWAFHILNHFRRHLMQKLRKLFPLVGAILALALVSCGSDSDDGSETATQQKTAGSISYATTSVEKTTADEAFTNALTKTGDGTVTYASSKTDVATVNATTGEVTIVGAGETTITATVADSDTYTYATKTASYTLTVTAADTAQQKTAGSISYATTTVSKTTDDEAFTNALTKTGDGTVTYSSSDETVATVNASTGEVTIVGAGTATITATVVDSDTYTYAVKTASYTVKVLSETLLTTITATGTEQASYSTANVATISFSHTEDGGSVYTDSWGWWGYGWTATVTPADGYTITKCVFYDNENHTATDSSSPFVVETAEDDKAPLVNGKVINMSSKGIKKIEVYGYMN